VIRAIRVDVLSPIRKDFLYAGCGFHVVAFAGDTNLGLFDLCIPSLFHCFAGFLAAFSFLPFFLGFH
jgi:hypothetical protein